MEDLGFRTSIVSEIPDSRANDSGFHRQNYWSRIPESTRKTSRIPDSTSKASRSPESGFSYMGRSVPGVTPKDWGQQNLWDLPTPSNEVTAPPRKLQRMYVCMYVDLQHFPPDPVHTHNIRPGVRCRLQNGFISFCVESSIEKVDLRLLIFLQRLCTPVMEFSRASLFSKLRIKKSVDKFHKPVSKTYRPGPNCSKVGNGL